MFEDRVAGSLEGMPQALEEQEIVGEVVPEVVTIINNY